MRLLADIGGTNARFALSAGAGRIERVEVLPVAAYPRFEDALSQYIDRHRADIDDAALAAAGPVLGGRVRMTNAPWVVSRDAVHAVLPGVPVQIVNDLAAVAQALPALAPIDLAPIQVGVRPDPPAPLLAVNVGTGFGAAIAVPTGAGWVVLPTEAGHIAIPRHASDGPDIAASATVVEDVLSGPGLKALHWGTPELKQSVSHLLGQVVGDLVLATGSWGGVYLCGGVLDNFDAVIDAETFLARLRGRPGPAASLGNLPVHHIRHRQPALLGLSTL